MKKKFFYHLLIIFSFFSLPSTLLLARAYQKTLVFNSFSNPKKVVQYVIKRMLAGAFYQNAFLETERRAFTTWTQLPNLQDSFYIANKWSILSTHLQTPNQVRISVLVSITHAWNAAGTAPRKAPETKTINFQLKKTKNGSWKITAPHPQDLPHLLDSNYVKRISQSPQIASPSSFPSKPPLQTHRAN